MQPLYSDNVGVSGTFTRPQLYLEDILAQGPPRGYLLETIKSILNIPMPNISWS